MEWSVESLVKWVPAKQVKKLMLTKVTPIYDTIHKSMLPTVKEITGQEDPEFMVAFHEIEQGGVKNLYAFALSIEEDKTRPRLIYSWNVKNIFDSISVEDIQKAKAKVKIDE